MILEQAGPQSAGLCCMLAPASACAWPCTADAMLQIFIIDVLLPFKANLPQVVYQLAVCSSLIPTPASTIGGMQETLISREYQLDAAE